MKSKLQLVLLLVFVALLQSANAQKASKKPELDMAKLMQHRNLILQKAAAQQRQQAADPGIKNQETRPVDASHGTNKIPSTTNSQQVTGTKRNEE